MLLLRISEVGAKEYAESYASYSQNLSLRSRFPKDSQTQAPDRDHMRECFPFNGHGFTFRLGTRVMTSTVVKQLKVC